MTAYSQAPDPLTVRWRTLEWWGCGLALFLQAGAIIPLLLVHGSDFVDDGARSTLRILPLPVYAITAVFLYRHWDQFLVALRRTMPMVALLVLPFASVLWSISPSISLRRAVGLLLSLALAYVLAIRFTPRQLLMLVAWVVVPSLVLSVLLAVAMPSYGFMQTISGMRGVFVHKNVLGWYAAAGVLVTGFMFVDGMVSRPKALALLAVSLICLVLSGSMTSMIGAAAATGSAAFYAVLRRVRGTARVLLVLVTLQAFAFLLFSISEFLLPLIEALGKDATLTGRIPLWRLVDEQIGHHILFGTGYQAFWTEASPDAWGIWAKIGWQAPHAHNGFRDVLLNFGVVGFLLFLCVIIRALGQGAALLTRAPDEGWLWLNVFMVMFMVMNLTESLFLVQNEFLFILFTTAIVMFGLRVPELGRGASLAAPEWELPAER